MGVAFGRKYATGTGADIYIPIVKRASVDFAVGADWTPAGGDVKISIDGAAAANIGTLPTAVVMGNTAMWKFVFTNGELTGKLISVSVSDSATKVVEDQFFLIETYGHASAMYQADLSAANLPANVVQIGGDTQSATDLKDFADAGYDPATHKVQGVVLTDTVTTYTDNTPQTGDSFALIGAAGAGLTALATSTALATMQGNVTDILADTGTDGVVLSAATNNAIADAVLSRGVSNVEDTADATSLCGIILGTFESSMAGTTWTINKTTGTAFTTKTLTVDAAADPITGVT